MGLGRHFICVVAGDNPDAIMKRYDNKTKVEPYCVYHYDKAKEYKETRIKIYEEALKQHDVTETMKELLTLEIETMNTQSDEDFYVMLTENLNIDENTGDAYSDINYDGKFDSYAVGSYAMPLGTDDKGEGIFSARKKDIDFKKIHNTDKEEYALAWSLIMENRKPKTDYEKELYKRIANWKNYFSSFGSKENYLACSTMFWGHAFTDGKEWFDCDICENQYKWVNSFFDHFIKPLPDNVLITIYDCVVI